MSGFIAVAGLLTLAALVALLYPLLRRKEESPEAWRSGGVVALLILVGAAGLYPLWSNFNWQQPAPAADSPEAMVGRLARRLEQQPDDLAGWLQLGRSYMVLGQFALAARAYDRADTLANGQSAEAAIGLAEALASNGDDDLAGRVGRLFEQALELDPNSAKALFYSALAAAERSEFPLARARFQRLLDADPPENVRAIIEDYMQELGAMEQMTASAPESSSPAAGTVAVPLRVTLSGQVAGMALPSDARVFVSARNPGVAGAPLAAAEIDEPRFPLEVELRSTDAVMGGSGFEAGQELEIKAHISLGGSALSRSGDPFGTVRVKAGSAARTTLQIDQLTP